MKTGTKIAVGLALCFVVGVIILIATHRPRLGDPVRSDVEREIARIRASGAPVSLADLAGEPIPDDQNAAVIYEQVFERLGYSESEDEEVINRIVHPDSADASSRPWDEARGIVSKYDDVIALVDQAVARPDCKFEVDWKDGISVLHPEFAELRRLSRFLAVAAMLQAKDGRASDALHILRLGFLLSDASKDSPTLIGQLVRIATLIIAVTAFQQMTPELALSERQAKQLFDTLQGIDLTHGLVLAMQGLRATGIAVFDQLHAGPAPPANADDVDLRDYLNTSAENRYADELFFLSEMAKHVDAARLPYRTIKSRNTEDALNPDVPDYALFSRIGVLRSATSYISRDFAQARIALPQLFLALEAYHDRFGSYPPSLDDLKTRLGWKLPEDPFSGKDLIYKPEKDGFTIYSIGPDLIDNHGRPQPERAWPDGPGDIVWKHTRP